MFRTAAGRPEGGKARRPADPMAGRPDSRESAGREWVAGRWQLADGSW